MEPNVGGEVMESIENLNTLVVDATLQCNMRCAYCRWGDGVPRRDSGGDLDSLVVDAGLLRETGVQRVVFSGGEPLLNANLPRVVEAYAEIGIGSIVVITNGLLASRERLSSLQRAGATGVAFSLDTVCPATAYRTRRLDVAQLRRVLRNLALAGAMQVDGWEVSVNAVLSAANVVPELLLQLATEVQRRGALWLKFQPIFDDGYLGSSAPDLRLGPHHSEAVRACGRAMSTHSLASNPAVFWDSLAAMLGGQRFQGASCGLAGRSWVLHREGLMICPWIQGGVIGSDGSRAAIDRFASEAARCIPGTNCFCMQRPSHVWRPA